MALFFGWKVRKSTPDAERTHLNKILEEISQAVEAGPSTDATGWNYITSEGDVYCSADEGDLYIGANSDA